MCTNGILKQLTFRISRILIYRTRSLKEKIVVFIVNVLSLFLRNKTDVIPNRIAIMTNTYRYTCNPKYIYEEIIRRNLDVEVIWIVNSKKKESIYYPDDAKLLNFWSLEGIKAIYSSKIWLDNGISFSTYFDKKTDQIHIQTMHGSLGIKRLDNAVICRNNSGYHGRKVVKREEENTNLVITNSKFEEDVFKSVFWHDVTMKRLGHARTDILFQKNTSSVVSSIRESLWKNYGVPKNVKLVLYGPTHRGSLTANDLWINPVSLCEELSKKFGGKYVVLLRLHDRSIDLIKDIESWPCCYNVSMYPDIQELMLVTDMAITDYSSWIYDYVYTRNPGLIFATDSERYNNITGFYYKLEETPFPVCHNIDELLKAVRNYDIVDYQDRVESFLNEKESVDDGHSSERIVDEILRLVK